jgi:hypothetical protein
MCFSSPSSLLTSKSYTSVRMELGNANTFPTWNNQLSLFSNLKLKGVFFFFFQLAVLFCLPLLHDKNARSFLLAPFPPQASSSSRSKIELCRRRGDILCVTWTLPPPAHLSPLLRAAHGKHLERWEASWEQWQKEEGASHLQQTNPSPVSSPHPHQPPAPPQRTTASSAANTQLCSAHLAADETGFDLCAPRLSSGQVSPVWTDTEEAANIQTGESPPLLTNLVVPYTPPVSSASEVLLAGHID